MIHTHGLTKKFDDLVAVNNLNLHVKKGEIYGFLGPNGAGKTTTIMMILGLLRPTEGSIQLYGMDLKKDYFNIKRKIGVLSEFQYLYEDMTAYEYLSFFADLYGVEKKKHRIQEVLEQVELFDRKDELLGGYSKGMKQKFGLARALLHRPEILILDEPQSSLDPHGIREVRDVLMEENRRGTTMLISSHILSEIERTCHRIGIMNKGNLVAEDDMQSLRRRLTDEVRIQIEVENHDDNLVKVIQQLPFVISASAEKNRIQATLKADGDHRGELFRTLSANGAVVLRLNQEEMSLEDAFVTITEKNISLLTKDGESA